jgi:hypothetical protein
VFLRRAILAVTVSVIGACVALLIVSHNTTTTLINQNVSVLYEGGLVSTYLVSSCSCAVTMCTSGVFFYPNILPPPPSPPCGPPFRRLA